MLQICGVTCTARASFHLLVLVFLFWGNLHFFDYFRAVLLVFLPSELHWAIFVFVTSGIFFGT